jgi:hypothetical protein
MGYWKRSFFASVARKNTAQWESLISLLGDKPSGRYHTRGQGIPIGSDSGEHATPHAGRRSARPPRRDDSTW